MCLGIEIRIRGGSEVGRFLNVLTLKNAFQLGTSYSIEHDMFVVHNTHFVIGINFLFVIKSSAQKKTYVLRIS